MNGYLAAFLIAVAVIVVCLFLIALRFAVARWETNRKATERVRPERAEEIDLAAVRYEVQSDRDSFLEAQQLGRVA